MKTARVTLVAEMTAVLLMRMATVIPHVETMVV